MNEHPSAFALECLAAGDGTVEARAHVETCPDCAAHVAHLRKEASAFAAAPLPAFLDVMEDDRAQPRAPERDAAGEREGAAVVRLAPAPRPGHAGAKPVRRVPPWVWTALPLAAAASAFVFLRTFEVPEVHEPPPTATSSPGTRFKGRPALAVVRERDGQQERFTGSVPVAPRDRLRVEIAVADGGEIVAGLLGQDGSWVVLLAPTMLGPGAHFSESAARFDDHPEPGWILAGPPEAVDHARATRDLSGVSALPVEVSPAP